LLIVGEWRHNHITSQITGLEAYIKSIAESNSVKVVSLYQSSGGETYGYAIFSNKLIFQWGQSAQSDVADNDERVVDVYYPIAFTKVHKFYATLGMWTSGSIQDTLNIGTLIHADQTVVTYLNYLKRDRIKVFYNSPPGSTNLGSNMMYRMYWFAIGT
jgi:hypothetical protein